MGGKGGGSSQPTETTVNQNTLPEYFRPYAEWMLREGQNIASEPYQSYQGPRLTPFSTDTVGSQNIIRDVAQTGAPDLGAARYYMNAGIGALGNNANYAPGQFDPGLFTQDVADFYMSPYINNVLNVQKDRAFLDYNRAQLDRNTEATRAGAFGGSRHGVIDALAQESLQRNLAEIDATGLQSAYENAQGMFGQDRNAAMQAQQWGEQSRQFGAQHGLGALTAGMQGANDLAALGSMDQSLALQRAQALGGVGGQIEGQQQSALDLAYSDFVNQRDYPRQSMGWYSSLLRGFPVSAQSEVSTYQAPPNAYSQLLGLGLGGLGLSQMWS